MACECCDSVRPFLHEWPMCGQHCPRCVYCGARYIQKLFRQPIAKSIASEKARAARLVWQGFGHTEADIKALVRAPGMAIEPLPKHKER